MDLLTNAIESIQIGVEDWQAGGRPRLIAAVRSIHAGILLLFKEALLRQCPPDSNEVLIKALVRPAPDGSGGIKHVGIGRRTVDARAIQERFGSLGINTDWKRFDEIARLRNDVEHYFADVSRESIQGLIANAFVIIRTFMVSELDEHPQDMLGHKTWDVMLKAQEVYDIERSECDDGLARVEWDSETLKRGVRLLRCPSCGSDLLLPVDGERYDEVKLTCRSCGESKSTEFFVPRAVEVALEYEAYVAMDDGGEDPVVDCPHCGRAAYVLDEDRCAFCGESVERTCSRCSCTIPASELGSAPLCGYCDHVMSKDD